MLLCLIHFFRLKSGIISFIHFICSMKDTETGMHKKGTKQIATYICNKFSNARVILNSIWSKSANREFIVLGNKKKLTLNITVKYV